MNSNELKNIDKQLLKYYLLGIPGVVFLSLGGYGLISSGDAFLSILNYENVCIGFILAGACIAGWEGAAAYPLLKKKAQLKVQNIT